MYLSRRRALVVSLAFSLAAVAGCDQGDGGPGDGPEGTFEAVSTVIVTHETEPQLYPLERGRYRVSWRHRCDEIGVRLQGADGSVVYERTSGSPVFSAIVSGVEQGAYEFLQTEEACAEYEIRLDRL